ncbi:uncharacterized protein LOC142322855 [Lycorma delicatula]|uniref:uncharacterized protein LOC142322855 n=1 Tax=Lycorma delicatula TaxID=130591 RepID=UPI003F5135FD
MIRQGPDLLMLLSGILIINSQSILLVNSHGRLIEPPSRASMWRYGFNTPPNYNDHELFCGGYSRQWVKNGGKCGICGDAWDLPQPRPHEAGGKYGQGLITRKYKVSSQFTIRVELTANHRGYFEFRLCPNNNPKQVATQQCLDKYVLRRVKPPARSVDEETRFFPGSENNKIFELRYMLPDGLTCSQCVMQWRYIAGNNWGTCENKTEMVGCGPQEEFRACADVAIEDGRGDTVENVVPDEDLPEDGDGGAEMNKVYRERSEDWWLLTLTIAISSLLLALTIYALLYFYYYHAGCAIKRWLHPINKSSSSVSPIPPPRTKKVIATIGFQGVPDNLV